MTAMTKRTLGPLLRSLNERHDAWLTSLQLTNEGVGQIAGSPVKRLGRDRIGVVGQDLQVLGQGER
jgi:hypothetical protein